ncbi:MAG: hypothetical protein IID34_00005 [Planctomycetes bacterium]|nr:hypothetical protein [Planctomycetota bacterium]
MGASPGSSLVITGEDAKTLDIATIELVGQAHTWDGEGDLIGNEGAVISIKGATFHVRTDADFVWESGSVPTLSPSAAGVLRKSEGISDGVTDVEWEIDSDVDSMVDVDSGTLRLKQSGFYSGHFTVGENGVLEFDGGSHVFRPHSVMDGAGPFRFLSGSVEVKGTYDVSRTEIDGGRVDFSFIGGSITEELTLGPNFSSVLGGRRGLVVSGPTELIRGTIDGSVTLRAEGGLTFSGRFGKTLNQEAVIHNLAAAVWRDAGSIDMSGNTVFLNEKGATFDITNDSKVNHFGGSQLFDNRGRITKSASEGTSLFRVAVENAGKIEIRSGEIRFDSSYLQTAGETRLDGGNLSSSQPLQIQGGRLTGVGVITADVVNGAVTAPGLEVGNLVISGDYTQEPGGTLEIEIGKEGHDQLTVIDTATLDGAIRVSVREQFNPQVGDEFEFLTAGAVVGTFAAMQAPCPPEGKRFKLVYGETSVTAKVVAFVPGDGNCDGIVNLLDYLLFFDCTTGPDGELLPDCAVFDFDEDRNVDLADHGAFQEAFTGP